MSSENLLSVLGKLYEDYSTRTPKRLKLVDVYLAYIMATGIIQFVYCLLVGTFPFNSFLAGFISCVGSFVLAGETPNGAHYLIQIMCCSHKGVGKFNHRSCSLSL